MCDLRSQREEIFKQILEITEENEEINIKVNLIFEDEDSIM